MITFAAPPRSFGPRSLAALDAMPAFREGRAWYREQVEQELRNAGKATAADEQARIAMDIRRGRQ